MLNSEHRSDNASYLSICPPCFHPAAAKTTAKGERNAGEDEEEEDREGDSKGDREAAGESLSLRALSAVTRLMLCGVVPVVRNTRTVD